MRKFTSIVVLLCAFLITGCGEIFAPVPGGYMKITARVLNEQNAPINKMRVIFGGVMTPDASLVGGDTLYTNDNGVVEYGTVCLTLGDYTTRLVLDDVNGVYAKDSVDVKILKTDFKSSKQYSLGVAEKEVTFTFKKKQ